MAVASDEPFYKMWVAASMTLLGMGFNMVLLAIAIDFFRAWLEKRRATNGREMTRGHTLLLGYMWRDDSGLGSNDLGGYMIIMVV